LHSRANIALGYRSEWTDQRHSHWDPAHHSKEEMSRPRRIDRRPHAAKPVDCNRL